MNNRLFKYVRGGALLCLCVYAFHWLHSDCRPSMKWGWYRLVCLWAWNSLCLTCYSGVGVSQDHKIKGKQVFKHKWTLSNFTGYESSQSYLLNVWILWCECTHAPSTSQPASNIWGNSRGVESGWQCNQRWNQCLCQSHTLEAVAVNSLTLKVLNMRLSVTLFSWNVCLETVIQILYYLTSAQMIHSHSWGPKQVSDKHSPVCKMITADKSLASGTSECVI